MKNPTYLIFLVILFLACQQSQNNPTEGTTDTQKVNPPTTAETATKISKEKKPLSETEIPFFTIQTYEDETGTPRSTIFVNIRDHEAEVTKAVACKKIETADYKNYKIPTEAVDACGGSQAGSGDYFYLIKKPDAEFFMVMHAAVDEKTSESNYNYNSVMSFAYRSK